MRVPSFVRLTILTIIIISFLSPFCLGAGNTNPAEIVSGRNANTRVWTVPTIHTNYDSFTGLPTGTLETVSAIYYEKGDGINYNSGTDQIPNWQPTITSITQHADVNYPYQSCQGPYQVKLSGSLSAIYPVNYSIGNSVLQLGLRSLAFYDQKNNILQTIQNISQTTPVLQGNTLTYSGVFPGVDVQYVYGNSFKQNLIFHSGSAISSPTAYQLDTSELFVVSVTEINETGFPYTLQDYAGVTVTNGFLSGENTELYFKDGSTGKIICQFGQSQAFDNQSNTHPVQMYKCIIQQNGHTYLAEGIPFSFFQSAQYPVTLDYNLKTGTQADNEVWKSGNTYYINGSYTVPSGNILAIEGGTVCKFSTGSQINIAAGATIIARGNKYNYILFTSANDASVGYATPSTFSSPSTGDYSYALNINMATNSGTYPASSTNQVQYCKIAYAGVGIGVGGGTGTASSKGPSNLTIANNIIRVGNDGMDIEALGYVNILNNLICVMNNYGIFATNNGSTNVLNCTIDTCVNGVWVTQFGAISQLKNTLITNCDTAIFGGPPCCYDIGYHDYNAFWNNYSNFTGNVSLFQNTHETILSSNPYVSSPNGGYYLFHPMAGLINAGDSSATVYGLDTKTTTTAKLILANITNSQTWSSVPRDTGTNVDIGYHFDPVDIIIGNSPTSNQYYVTGGSASLSISTGLVIAFYRSATSNNAYLQATQGGIITFLNSTASPQVDFTSIYATGSLNTQPLRGGLDTFDYDYGILLQGGSNPATSIQNGRFQYALIGVLSQDTLNNNCPIQNNTFRNNQTGAAFANIPGNMVNNLFVNNTVGLKIKNQNIISKPVYYVQSNTFYGNQTGIQILNLTISTCSTIVRLENNIFQWNSLGAAGNNTTYCFISTESRNNVYFDNSTDVDGSNVRLNTSGGDYGDNMGANPMLVHQATLANNSFLNSTTNDGFYLAQNMGDASRTPLRSNAISKILINTLSGSVNSIVAVYSANGVCDTTLLGSRALSQNYVAGSQASTTGNLLVEITNKTANPWNLNSTNNSFWIIIYSETTVTVYLPTVSMALNTSIWLWVAQDGSLYYADTAHGVTANPNQDAWFAMQYDMPLVSGRTTTGLAQSAYSAGGRGCAVDQGSVKVTTINSTTYRYTTMASLGNTNTNGIQDNSSTIRIIPPTLSTNTVDPLGRLDIGYHYNGNVIYTTDMVTAFIYQPSGKLYTYSPASNYNSIGHDPPYPFYQNDIELRKTVSGKYDSVSFNPTEIITMTGIGPLVDSGIPSSRNYTALGYHIYNTPIVAAFDEISSHPYSQNVSGLEAGALGPYFRFSGLASSPTGQVFSMLQGFNHFGSASDCTTAEFLYVYRYDDSSYSWTKVITLETTLEEDVPYGGVTLQGADIAVDTANLWIAISSIASQNFIGVDKLPINTLPQTIGLGSFISVQIETTYANPVKITYDASTGWVRILYNDQDDSNNMHALDVNTSQFGVPTFKRDTVAAMNAVGGGIDPSNYELVYNPNDPTGGTERAYALYNINANAEYAHLDASNSLYDLWYSYSTTFGNYYGTQHITYRFDGTALVAYSGARDDISSNGGYMHTNSGDITAFFNDGGFYLDVKTNAVNHRDIISTWHEFTNPSNSNDFSGVVVCQELYP